MMDILSFWIPYLANVVLLFILVLFIFALLSSFLFDNIIKGVVIGKYFNFFDFWNSFILWLKMNWG